MDYAMVAPDWYLWRLKARDPKFDLFGKVLWMNFPAGGAVAVGDL